jgi:hypothetical protein
VSPVIYSPLAERRRNLQKIEQKFRKLVAARGALNRELARQLR